ncbi:MAG TPA: hypothetical protein VNH11_15620 [Pirellulales bacterium]|nr:hypothetical protein [Pirellulales bacterium]
MSKSLDGSSNARLPSIDAPFYVLTLCLVMGFALAAAPAAAQDSRSRELAELCREHKGDVASVSGDEVEAARKQLAQAVARLEVYLTAGGKNGAAWKRYLLFPDLLTALKRNGGDGASLNGVLARFRANHAGLELPVFQNVAASLQRYLRLVREQVEQVSSAELDEQLERLAVRLAEMSDPPTAQEVAAISDSVAWLHEHGQCREVVAQVRRRLSHPNLQVRLSEEMVSSGSLRAINDVQPQPVRDAILGTQILGSGRTVGWARTRLLPDERRALFETSIVATNRAQTVGYNGPARIYSSSTTQLKGTKRFYLDASGFHVWTAASQADARSQIRGIGSNKHGLMDRVVRRVASKRVAQQKRAAERVAARHAERQLNARLDAEANAQLGRAHADFMNKLRNPLVRLGQWPRQLRMASTAGQFRLLALHDGDSRLAAPTAPPAMPDDAALVVQLHESLVNNYGDGLFSGQTLRQADLDRLSLELFGRRPSQLEYDEQKGPWAITFGSHEPIVLRVDGGRASLTVRGRRFASDLRTIDTPLDVTAHYRLSRENQAVKAVREGDLEVYPAGFVADGKRRMSLRQSRDASYVRHRFDDFFTPEIASQGLLLPGYWARVGRLELVELRAEHGWITLAWRQPASPLSGENRQARVPEGARP